MRNYGTWCKVSKEVYHSIMIAKQKLHDHIGDLQLEYTEETKKEESLITNKNAMFVRKSQRMIEISAEIDGIYYANGILTKILLGDEID